MLLNGKIIVMLWFGDFTTLSVWPRRLYITSQRDFVVLTLVENHLSLNKMMCTSMQHMIPLHHRKSEKVLELVVKEHQIRGNNHVLFSAHTPILIQMIQTPSVRRALIVGCGLQIIQQVAGINTVM